MGLRRNAIKLSSLGLQALNSRLQHGVLDAHARQRAMRRDMRAVTSERQTSHALAPAENAPGNVPFPGPPINPGMEHQPRLLPSTVCRC